MVGVIICVAIEGRDMMTKVVVQNGNVDLALKKFKAKFARSGVPSELKKRKCYEKPGVKRRNEKNRWHSQTTNKSHI